MDERRFVDDLTELVRAASEAITDGLRDGSKNGHKHGDWLTQSYDHHLDHARGHVAVLLDADGLDEDERQTALSHAITRLVMAWNRRGK